jgi:ketopantoate hydroxymethyltransferase
MLRSLPDLASFKHAGRKIVAVVAWDVQMARIAERAGVDLVSARIVAAALARAATEELTVEWLRDTFLTALASAGPPPVELA